MKLKSKYVVGAALLALGGFIGFTLVRRRNKKGPLQLQGLFSREFIQATETAKKIGGLETKEQLQLYALFKQTTVGDVNVPEPPGYDVINRTKWQAWKEFEGTTRQMAELMYIGLVQNLAREHQGNQPQNAQSGAFGQKVSTMKPSELDTNEAYQNKFNIEKKEIIQDESLKETVEQLHSLMDSNKTDEFVLILTNSDQKKQILEYKNEQGITLLHQSIEKSSPLFNMLAPLYAEYGIIDIADSISGMTPLHYAALQENEDYALILVNSGANPEQKDFSGETPLESSSQEFRRKVFRL